VVESGAMPRPVPTLPEYRITLFYGPETAAEPPRESHCVFNVKKRSWKGGIQLEVRLSEAQLHHLSAVLRFEQWLDNVLPTASEEDTSALRQRAHDLLVQQACSIKLELAIAEGIAQQNGIVGAASYADELSREVPSRRDRIIAELTAELDLPGR